MSRSRCNVHLNGNLDEEHKLDVPASLEVAICKIRPDYDFPVPSIACNRCMLDVCDRTAWRLTTSDYREDRRAQREFCSSDLAAEHMVLVTMEGEIVRDEIRCHENDICKHHNGHVDKY